MTRRTRRVVLARIGIAAPPECRSGQARPERGVATTAATGILIVDGRRDAGRAEAVSKAASYAWIRSTASYEFRPCFARIPAHVRAFVFSTSVAEQLHSPATWVYRFRVVDIPGSSSWTEKVSRGSWCVLIPCHCVDVQPQVITRFEVIGYVEPGFHTTAEHQNEQRLGGEGKIEMQENDAWLQCSQ